MVSINSPPPTIDLAQKKALGPPHLRAADRRTFMVNYTGGDGAGKGAKLGRREPRFITVARYFDHLGLGLDFGRFDEDLPVPSDHLQSQRP